MKLNASSNVTQLTLCSDGHALRKVFVETQFHCHTYAL